MSDPWFTPEYGGSSVKGPANWKGWAVTLSFVLALTGISVATFGVALGRTPGWPEFIGWIVGSVVLGGFFQLIVHLTSSADKT